MNRDFWIALLIILLLLGGGYLFVQRDTLFPAQTTAQAASQAIAEPTLPAVKASGTIIATAKVVPMQHAALRFAASGLIEQVLVNEGDRVDAGKLLAKLENLQQQAAVDQAGAKVLSMKSRLEELMNGNPAAQIESAKAGLAAAQAKLAQVGESALAEDIRAAKATVVQAQQALQQKLQGADESQLIEARANLKNAEAELQQAQSAYNEVKWRSDIGALPQSADLQRATNNYEAAKSRLDLLTQGASAPEIAQANAEIEKAQAQLDKLRLPPNANQIAQAEAEVRRLQAELELLQQGARKEQIQSAAADLFAAEADLRQAEANLAETELRAPFTGTVAVLNLVAGEQAEIGQVAIQLADFEKMQIETEDLTEINVVNVQTGAPVTVTFDAIPNLAIPGKVERIQSFGDNQQGDIVYKAIISLAAIDPRLRWNMSAEANIQSTAIQE